MFNTQILAGSSGQGGEVQQSLKFNDDESQYLSWTPAAAGNRKTWTWSAWVKPSAFGKAQPIFSAYTSTTDYTILGFDLSGFIGGGDSLKLWSAVSNSTVCAFTTNAVFRDPSAWYHIVVETDTTQATSTDRVKVYVNGEQITSFSTATYPAQNADAGMVNATTLHQLGTLASGTYGKFDGYLSNIHFIDGQALDPTSFGQFTNGYWEKKDYAGTYGTNGFHLTFQDDVVSEGFNTVTWTGTGQRQSVSGLGFSPDLIWNKSRNASDNHLLVDSLRGASKGLVSNLTRAETTSGATNDIVSFDGDGFTTGVPQNYSSAGSNGYNIVSWCWDAGSGSPVSNTDGTITSTVKANPDYGFSVVSYTGNGSSGATVGHSLGAVPKCIILKWRNGASNWRVHHASVGTGKTLFLNLVNVESADADRINGVSSTTFTLSTGNASVNGSGSDYIAYCWTDISGYSSFGSYSGTGSANNAVTGLGFKPAFLMVKGSDVAEHWVMFDNTRNPANPVDDYLLANSANAEATNQSARAVDFDADGFTVDGTGTEVNQSGKNYIYMAFADTREAAFWKDVSGQGNNWTPNNLDYRDSLPDSPANNFATLNPLIPTSSTTAEGNLKANLVPTNTSISSTFAVNSGKWYAEFVPTTIAGYALIGISSPNETTWLGGNSIVLQSITGNLLDYGDWVASNSSLSTTYTVNDVIGVALDLDGSTIEYFKNGSSIGSATIALGTTNTDVSFMLGMSSASATGYTYANFGQDSTFAGAKPMGAYTDDSKLGTFQYQPPAGFKSLCSQNLPIPTIVDGTEYFNTVLYTGNGGTQTITGVGFQPDLTWVKGRSIAQGHSLYDVIRGYDYKVLSSDSTSAQVTETGGVSAVASDGFTLTGNNTIIGGSNSSGQTYAAWNWLAGGTAVSNTAGTITSQVSANPTAGFSIVSYTGNGTHGTIGHGLSGLDMLIVKDRSTAENWAVWHSGIPITQYLRLNSSNAAATPARKRWNDTSPTSTVFSVGDSADIGDREVNQNGENYIAYCFANTDGYLKAGSYTGNGSTSNPPFVFTGFRPAWVLIKCSSAGSTNWLLLDNKREGYNSAQDVLFPESSAAEETNAAKTVDFLSNGFKVAATANVNTNANGSTYIFLAFAETPFKYANAR
jgi:hypothetical protein